MPLTNYKVATVDLDTLFEPWSSGDPFAAVTGCKVAGVDLNTLYAPASVGTPSPAITNYKQGGVEIAPRFAVLGSRTGGGGGGGACVSIDMWLNYGLRAGRVALGDLIDCAAYKPIAIEQRQVNRNSIMPQPCHRIATTSGAAVVASDSTPMTLRDGSTCYLPDMMGREALVDGPNGLRWEVVVECEPVGQCDVVFINVDNGCYFAGEDAGNRIATHNSDKT